MGRDEHLFRTAILTPAIVPENKEIIKVNLQFFVMTNLLNNREKSPAPELDSEAGETKEEAVKEYFPERKKEIIERKELTEAEKEEKEKLKQEIEKAKLPEEKQAEALKEAERLKVQSVQGIIRHLLDLAQNKGLSFAIETARKMEDPYLLDLFHDTLVKQGLYKQFLSK